MALHKDFPRSPHKILEPSIRWFPGDEELRTEKIQNLLPPLVTELRKKIKEWRENNYERASDTSKILLEWWFKKEHPIQKDDGTVNYFRYYFSQREAIETIIYLYEVMKIKDKYDLLRFDSTGRVSAAMFTETWKRFVIKMATGSGKTKVLSLIVAWCFFHKLYEPDSALAQNFLIIAPNIIVLDRLRADFEGLRIFSTDPIIPENGYEGRDWKSDFQMTLHIQDQIGTVRKTGNIFLTNIHRVYENSNKQASFQDDDLSNYFLGNKPVTKTNESQVDLGQIIRDIDELIVLNDEAHHIHDEKMAWFKSIEDIHNRLVMKGGQLSLQIDVTATPKHNNGSIFVQTISDYPLVEAIYQDVVKHPVLPDSASRAKLVEKKSSKYSEKYEDYLELGYLEWKKASTEHKKMGKKAVLFVMTDDTKNCDEVAEYLENRYQDLKGAVLTIHTKNNGEISENVTGKTKEELEILRKAANQIDKAGNKYKAIVSVLMLKEGWDVRNVTTIVGLRAYSSKAQILPEQTLGRGLRRMYWDPNIPEKVSVVGTDAFMDFVESIKSEGVRLEYKRMDIDSKANTPMIVEIDNQNVKKDIPKLDIEIPVLTPRIYREYKNLSELNLKKFDHKKINLKQFSKDQQREIVFKDITTGEITHKTKMDSDLVPDYQSVIGYFTQTIMKGLRLVSGYDILYGKVKDFIINDLFTEKVNIEDLNTLRNLSELEATKIVIENFKKQINDLTILDKGEALVDNYIKISKCRPFLVKDQSFLIPKKSPFNKIFGDSHFELEFAAFLENCDDIISYVKNYFAVQFKIDYQKSTGEISNFFPDFIIKKSEKEIYIVELKGAEYLDDPLKIKRLSQWCDDINKVQKDIKSGWLYVKEKDYKKYLPKSFSQLLQTFHLRLPYYHSRP
jgi:type III restriction enzyme